MMLYDVKFNMNAQTWLLNHYWLFLLEYFFPPRGGLVEKAVWAICLCLFYLQLHCYGIDTGSEPGSHHKCIINIIRASSMIYTYFGHTSSMHHQLSMVHQCNFDGMMMMVIECWAHQKCTMNCWIMINHLWWFMNEWWVNCEWIINFIHSW